MRYISTEIIALNTFHFLLLPSSSYRYCLPGATDCHLVVMMVVVVALSVVLMVDLLVGGGNFLAKCFHMQSV